jgi:hypothetical protein
MFIHKIIAGYGEDLNGEVEVGLVVDGDVVVGLLHPVDRNDSQGRPEIDVAK